MTKLLPSGVSSRHSYGRARSIDELEDRIIGCIVGGAIGDSLGLPYEGRQAPFSLQETGAWALSDDTQLTLATCEAITASGRVDPSAIASHFGAGFRESRFTGLGASTYKALSELGAGAHWALVGRKGEMAAGNGAAMRIAPLAFCLDPSDSEARRTIRDVWRITHHNEEAYAGALAVVVAIRAVLAGRWTGGPGLLGIVKAGLPDSSVRDRIAEIASLAPGEPIAEASRRFGCSSYVVESVPLALYAAEAAGAGRFTEAMMDLIRCGGDTDTNASIAGQLIGSLVGYRAITPSLIDRLPEKDGVMAAARRFAACPAILAVS